MILLVLDLISCWNEVFVTFLITTIGVAWDEEDDAPYEMLEMLVNSCFTWLIWLSTDNWSILPDPFNSLSIVAWKMAGAVFTPKGNLENIYNRRGVFIVVSDREFSSNNNWVYAPSRSNKQKNLLPPSSLSKSSITGKGSILPTRTYGSRVPKRRRPTGSIGLVRFVWFALRSRGIVSVTRMIVFFYRYFFTVFSKFSPSLLSITNKTIFWHLFFFHFLF